MSSPERHPGGTSGEPLTAGGILHDLGTKRLGRRVEVHAELDSTNRTAHALAEAGEPEGAIVIAETQTGDREGWEGSGLPLRISTCTSPSSFVRGWTGGLGEVPLLAAVAVADTLKDHVPCEPRIKWPNDVLLRGRKAAGILSELAASPAGPCS